MVCLLGGIAAWSRQFLMLEMEELPKAFYNKQQDDVC